ncbi:MAG: PQQ-binding-like beta-propeller repeat protein, partial [Aliifodinibius sp.]|nr:PQQ-binding-like beta-propeller repeat protein [candidate division Zixibacteria bacterium]NIT61663.1 PQQ-binding-like beta-propeller repeat protein [Fodinibius sp.]NIU13169.1 PQQ-binding-like beta-propeller repeat protein [candidate division Zixibacteria bacterium]NIV16286.1 PQQ-binding-like beta-propeller repeat protein [Fodinibius sp.]NIY30243.1 PQQ-binding-like beta-propeller repeat protein [Fodinibius sp.]
MVDLDGSGGLSTAIIAASLSGKVYAIDNDGSQRWVYDAQDIVRGTPGFCDVDGNGSVEVFIGSSNGNLYGVKHNGAALQGFPLGTGENIESSPVFSDLNGDGAPEMIVSTMVGFIHVYDFGQGTWYSGFPV